MAKILLLNGPNLNMLGEREPQIYGRTTLAEIEERIAAQARAAGHELLCKQSNAEGALVDWLQEHRDAAFVLINAASLTHTSLALRDALAFVGVPFVEIHISNVYKREPFRHRSFLSDLAVGTIVGLGALGYDLALQYALHHIRQNSGGG